MNRKNKYKSVLITGVSGFIGGNVARYFAQKGCVVTGLDLVSPDKNARSKLKLFYKVDLSAPLPAKIFKQNTPQLCIHCAGSNSPYQSFKDPESDFYANTVATFNLLNALRFNADHCPFLLISSAAVYGNPKTLPVKESHKLSPISPYGFHKLQCEQLCREFYELYGLPTAAVRIFSAYGNGLKRQVIWDTCKKIFERRPLILQGTGNESRDFIHISDICKGMEAVADLATMKGEVYNLASGREVTIKELAGIIIAACGRKGEVIKFDNAVPLGVPLNWRADIRKIKALGFKTSVTLEDGLAAYVDYFKGEPAPSGIGKGARRSITCCSKNRRAYGK